MSVPLFNTLAPCALADTAATPTWEIFGATSTSFFVQSFGDGTDADKTWSAFAGVNRFLDAQWELGGNLSVRKLNSPDGDSSHIQATFGPTYNLSADSTNSFYGSVQVGFRLSTLPSTRSYNTLAYYLAIGKRISLAEHVSWSPEISYSGRTEGKNAGYTLPSTSAFGIVPFQIAVLF